MRNESQANQHDHLVSVLEKFGVNGDAHVRSFGTGLINRTWEVVTGHCSYILQKINQDVFSEPGLIAENISALAEYLSSHFPDYLFVAPIRSTDGSDLLNIAGDGYYRLFPFVQNSVTRTFVASPKQAFEAAKQFGKFTRLLEGFDASQLNITINRFHDLSFRYDQFLSAVENGNPKRIKGSHEEISFLRSRSGIVRQYQNIISNPDFKVRVTHHDTKISNVLFDENDNGLCVIDLDTVMQGYFISDVGDMMRTYLCPVSEEETDLSKIEIRDDIYKAIVDGYCEAIGDVLSKAELGSFFYAGKFMIYMQALRFLTDHLSDDIYYGAKYPGHNLNRAKNQIVLLRRLMEKEPLLSAYGSAIGPSQ